MRNAHDYSYDNEDMYAPPKRKPTPRRKQTLANKALDAAKRNPKRLVCGIALTAVASVIALNALVMQTSRHPAPMFAAAPPQTAVVPAPMVPPPRPVEQAAAPAPAAVPVAAAATESAPPAPRDVIGDIIRTGSTNQVSAQVPRSAVTATAQPTRLASATAPAPRTVAVPHPPQRRDAIGDMIRSSNAPAAQPSVVAAVDDVQKRKIASVQQALNKLNYGPLPADGKMGAGTQKAIKRFELDRLLPVTGTLNPQTLAELSAKSRVAIR